MHKIIAIDLGGTQVKLGVFIDGKLDHTEQIDTLAQNGAKDVIQRIITWLHTFTPFDAIGISTCGQVNTEDGSIHYANENMPGYTGMHVKEIFEQEFHVKVCVENDVYCAARGEHTFGAAKGYHDFACITYGTGIGGGIYLNDQPYYGTGHNKGIMLGAMLTHVKPTTNSWDNSYEHYASTTALVKQAQHVLPSIQNGKDIFTNIDNPDIKQVLDAWIQEVAQGICSIIHVYNLPLILLGGGIFDQEYVYQKCMEEIQHTLIDGYQGVHINKAQLGNLAGIYGAYALVNNL